MDSTLDQACDLAFGRVIWRGTLSDDERGLVAADVEAIYRDEMKTEHGTVFGRTIYDAARVLRQRIGGQDALPGYARCLAAGRDRAAARRA